MTKVRLQHQETKEHNQQLLETKVLNQLQLMVQLHLPLQQLLSQLDQHRQHQHKQLQLVLLQPQPAQPLLLQQHQQLLQPHLHQQQQILQHPLKRQLSSSPNTQTTLFSLCV